jgi:transposase
MPSWRLTGHAGGAERIDADVGARLEARYQRLLADRRAANPPPPANSPRPGRTRRSPAANLLERVDGHRDEVLRFLDDLRLPFTNKQAERDLRMVKLQQKSPAAGGSSTARRRSWRFAATSPPPASRV